MLFLKTTDWETIADRAPNELLSPPSLPDVSTLSMEDNKAQITKRRGRGTFSYQKEELYSDRQSEGSTLDDTRDEAVCHDSEEKTEIRHCKLVVCIPFSLLHALF